MFTDWKEQSWSVIYSRTGTIVVLTLTFCKGVVTVRKPLQLLRVCVYQETEFDGGQSVENVFFSHHHTLSSLLNTSGDPRAIADARGPPEHNFVVIAFRLRRVPHIQTRGKPRGSWMGRHRGRRRSYKGATLRSASTST